MDGLTISAASGMRARMESLELLANNIANQSAAGYKADREFYNLYVAPEAQAGGAAPPATLPVIERHWTDFSQGALTPTGNPWNVALSGPGLFQVQGPNEVLYTRNGNFRLSPDGQLETEQGYAVLDSSGAPIRVDPLQAGEITEDGTVMQQGQPVARLGVVDFDHPEALDKLSGCYFRQTDPQVVPQPATGARIQQGKLEGANFSPAEAAVRLVQVMRQFEMLQRAIAIGSDMGRKAAEEVGRVGS